jgi:signal transduction histidine kinase
MSAWNMAGQSQQKADSLVQMLETQNLTSEERFDLYHQIGAQYVYNNQEKFKEYTDKALELAYKEKNKKMIVRFTNSLGIFYNHKASYDTAITYLEKALKLAEEIKDKKSEADVLLNLAVSNCNKGDIKTGIDCYHRVISINESLGTDQNLSFCYANMGARYRQLGEYSLAIRYLEKAESLSIKNNEISALAKVYSSLGNLYNEQKEYDKAIEYGLKSLKVAQEAHNQLGEAYAYQVLINGYLSKDQYKDAEKYAESCLQVANEVNYKRGIVIALHALSNIYLNTGRYQEAENCSFQAWETDSTNLYAGSGIMGNISQANIFLGNKEKALRYFQKCIDMKDEFNNNSIRESLMEMETKYETEKKEMQIVSLAKQQQLYVWLVAIGFLLAIALGIALWQKHRNAQREKQLVATRSILEGEMKERARLAQDLHDRLSGNLSAVKIELATHAETLQNVRDKLDNCIKDIRNAAHNLMPSSLQFGMKVALEDFAAQFPNVKFHFFGEEQHIDDQLEFVIYCCANELVNNAIKHSGATNINLQLVQDKKHVTLTVSDDGVGFDEKTVTKGLGLKSIRDRVASCDGKIDISTAPGKGTETTIELRVNS